MGWWRRKSWRSWYGIEGMRPGNSGSFLIRMEKVVAASGSGSHNPKMAASRCADNARPDLRIPEVLIDERFEGFHVRPIVERKTDRSRLPPSPSKSTNLRVALVKGACPLLAAFVFAARRDALVQSERPRSGSDHVEDRDRLANTDYADAPSRITIDEAVVPEGFRYRS
jgi:hypothetical protein